jgi:Zn-dependent protease with chaperone function
MEAGASPIPPPVLVNRWPTERSLLAFVVLAAMALWVLIAVSLIGIFYAVMLGVFFFFAHLVFIAHLRGNGVRLGPEQMPELHARVAELAGRPGMRRAPDAYVIQAGGALNALATRFLGSQFIVLYSDLIDACGDNTEARDFIIAHELGHLRAGHLKLRWLLAPGLLVPFLGTAYSRACEYTSDRYGLAGSRDPERALDGLCILAAGGRQGPRVNRRALVAQRADLNTFWMTLGQWLSTHPPVAARLAALQPSLGDRIALRRTPAFAAGAVVALLVVLPFGATVAFVGTAWPKIMENLRQQQRQASIRANPEAARLEAEAGMKALVEAAETHHEKAGGYPTDEDHLYAIWVELHPGESEPRDPFDGERFGYSSRDGAYVIWSTGPDATDDKDDIEHRSGERVPGGIP